ncbi:MAG: pyridoxamine 5'-phosphate oxidase family protein [Candidatus Krumholzibacteriales bacterium]
MGTRKITDRAEIDRIINSAEVCRLGMSDSGGPYVVPVSFGYDGRNIYIHTGTGGRKIDCFESGRPVCFEFEQSVELITDRENPCGWTFSFRSVIGCGAVTELEGKEKIEGLQHIMGHYSGREWENFDRRALEKTRAWKIAVSEVSGRVNGE